MQTHAHTERNMLQCSTIRCVALVPYSVMRATVLHIYRDYMPPDCKMRLMVKVVREYKGPGVKADDVETICMVKSPIDIELGMDYLFAGDYDTKFMIKPNGYIEAWNTGRKIKSSTKAKKC